MGHKRKKWTIEEIITLEALLKEGFATFAIIGMILGRSRDSVCLQAGRLGLKSQFELRKYSKNEDFWAVPNPINSYYAGLWAADGTVNWENNFIAITLNHKDKKEIDNFIKHCEFTGETRIYKQHSLFGGGDIVQLQINSAEKWNQDMYKNFNLFPQKTYRIAPPNLDRDLLKACFILGYLDGDGSISFTEKSSSISISSASKEILEWIKSFVDAHFGSEKNPFKANVVKIKDKECWSYMVTGNRCVHMFDFFKSLPTPKFKRKWENEEILKNVKRKKDIRPEVFKDEFLLKFDQNGNIIHPERDLSPRCYRLKAA